MTNLHRIIIHWSAGAYQPNSIDFEHYHYLINSEGIVIEGKHKPEDNLDCTDGNYAQHTGGGNTGSIGVAFCGMLGYKNSTNVGNYPLTRVQCERGFKLIAELCAKYNINISPETVMTHYEFGKKNPRSTSAGKIDITYLPCYPEINANDVGTLIRAKAKWYLKRFR